MFLDGRDFGFVADLEAHWEAIRDEYRALPGGSFQPWVQRRMYEDGWSVFGLYALGQPIPPALEICPQTAAVLAHLPGLVTAGFSRLAPGAHVTPHSGWAQSVYRLHLGLVVPPDCRLRVGVETREWQEGRCLIFDDTVEHEAWNRSDRPRTVLLLDFVRPGRTMTDALKDPVPDEVRRYAEIVAKRRR
jgi:aspartyl/asparaginyl beta-hydroxylase (cupin superfamily)